MLSIKLNRSNLYMGEYYIMQKIKNYVLFYSFSNNLSTALLNSPMRFSWLKNGSPRIE